MNNVTLAVPENFAAELVRRGLPNDYAQRAAAELADHRADLIRELEATGIDSNTAAQESIRRLGDDRSILKKTVREFQRRYWCGRWPLVSFVLAPVPSFVGTWFLTSWLSISMYQAVGHIGQRAGIATPTLATIALIKLIVLGGATAVIAPLVLTFLFHHVARRSGCGRGWALVSICQIAFLASLLCFQMDGIQGMVYFEPAMFRGVLFASTFADFLRTYFVQPSQALQFVLPLTVFAIFVGMERRKRRMVWILEEC
jgi:hypothetical protein